MSPPPACLPPTILPRLPFGIRPVPTCLVPKLTFSLDTNFAAGSWIRSSSRCVLQLTQ